MTNRHAARPAMAARYGQSGCRCSCRLMSMEWSIARWMRIGIVIEISVYRSEHVSAKTPSRHCSRQMRSRRRKVGSMPRSGGSTEFAYVDMAMRPSVTGPLPARRATADDTSAAGCALTAFLELRVGQHAAAVMLRACGRLEIGLGGRLRQGSRRRRFCVGLRLARRLGLRGDGACELGPLLLELDAQPGELPLDLSDRLLTLVEPLPLRLGERELLNRLAFALLHLRDGAGELVGTVWACGIGGPPPTLSAGHLEPQLLELLLARSDALRVFAQRPLHLLDLGECLLVAVAHVQPVAHRRKCVFETGWWQPSTALGVSRPGWTRQSRGTRRRARTTVPGCCRGEPSRGGAPRRRPERARRELRRPPDRDRCGGVPARP